MNMKELHEKLGSLGPKDIILDVRTPDEYNEGHIEGAINISHDEVMLKANDLKNYEKIYVHCKMGKRAQVACDSLAQAGLSNQVCVDEDGIVAWQEAGFPLVK